MAMHLMTVPKPLIVRVRNWVGDVILGLPALQLIESKGFELHLVARGKWAPSLLAGYGWPVHVQPAGLQAKVLQLRQLRHDLTLRDPDFAQRENALLLPVSFSAALEMRMAGLKPVGVAKEGRSPLLARAEPWAETGHELERYWDIACRFVGHQGPAPRNIGFQVQASKAAQAQHLLATHGVTGAFTMICPFAGGKAATADKADKKWPGFESYATAAAARLGMPLVICPGPDEQDEARQLYPTARLLNGADMAVYAGVLQRASLVVANDTGPGHMAAALGRPLISLLGPTEAARWSPWGPNVHVLQHTRQGTLTAWPSAKAALELSQQLLRA